MPTPAATALADQHTAATRHAAAVITATARTLGTEPVIWPRSPWLAHQVRQLARAIAAGRARYCPHLPASPQLIHAAVWAPWHLACTTCARTLRPSAAEDITCDRCRAAGRPLHAGALAVGPVILNYGLCGPCADATGLRGPGATTARRGSGPAATRPERPSRSRPRPL